MTHTRVRHKPNKKPCPKCGREIAYTYPYRHRGGIYRDKIMFYNHKNLEGENCG